MTETETTQASSISVVDRAISFLSPRWAAQRIAWRGTMRAMEASYKGGVPTRTSENWQPASASRFGLASERTQQASARNRAYQAFKNNPVARTLIQTECDNVIGDGLNYQPTSLSTAWNEEAIDRYYRWLDSCSVRGGDIHAGSEVQRLLWERSRIAGDVGWALIAQGNDSLIQMIPAERIVTPDGMFGDKDVVDGVRFDEYGAPSVFYVLIQDDRAGIRRFQPIGARDFVFFAHMPDPNQARGESAFMTIFELLSHLDRYVDGVSLAAWMATVFGIVFKQADAAKQLNMLSSLTNSQGNPQKALTIENGMVKYIGAADEVVQVDAKQPMLQTPQFIDAMYRMLGQPFDMPIEVIAKNMSQCTFASARIGLLPFYRACRIKAGRFGHRWSRTIRWWLSRERLRGRDDPKRWTTVFPPDYWNHDLLVNAWEYTDPISEAQSDQLQIDMGTKSAPMVIAERGRDAEKIVRERTEWIDKTKDLPATRSTLTRDPTETREIVDRKFKQQLTIALAKHPGQAAVIYNVTDIPKTLTDAGGDLDATVDSPNGDAVPLLPVEDNAGNMVSGEAIEDMDGKLVGGDVELTAPPEGNTGANKQSNPTEDAQDTEGVDDPPADANSSASDAGGD